MSGSTFTVVFTLVYAMLLVLDFVHFTEINQAHFYFIGVPYFLYFMFALVGYKTTKELCFYCRFTLRSNPVILTVMLFFYLESFPMMYFWVSGFLFFATVVIKGL